MRFDVRYAFEKTALSKTNILRWKEISRYESRDIETIADLWCIELFVWYLFGKVSNMFY